MTKLFTEERSVLTLNLLENELKNVKQVKEGIESIEGFHVHPKQNKKIELLEELIGIYTGEAKTYVESL